jgi:putative exporter of polyketide antibiotics
MNIAVGIGFFLLVVPGLYIWGRLLVASPAMVAEERRNPIDALKRGFALSAGQGWRILGLYLLVMIPGAILVLIASQLSGILFILVAGQQLGLLLGMIVLCAMSALVATILTMLTAAIYLALAPPRPDA